MIDLEAPLVRLAVISDLHAFASPEKSKDSVMDLTGSNNNVANPLIDLIDAVTERGLTADVLVCAGDICNQADLPGLQRAWEKIHVLSHALRASQTISTCGNHDLDSRYLSKESDPDPKGFLLSLNPPFPFEDEPLNDRYWARNYAMATLSNGVVIVSLNSSAFHGGKPEEIDHGRVSRRTIDALCAELRGKRTASAHILLCHHHPAPQSGWQGRADIEYIANGPVLLDELTKATDSSWLVIHGHRHVPRLIHGASPSNRVPFIFGAGSLGARIPGVANQFHMVDIHQSAASDHTSIVGAVRTWSWTDSAKWTSSTGPAGLPAACGFGYQGQTKALASQIDALVGQSFAPWTQVRSSVPSVDLLLPDSLSQLVRDLESLGIQINYAKDGQPSQVGR